MKHPARSAPSASATRPRAIARGVHAARGVHLTLRTVREAVGSTQAELAAATGMDQADVSRLERRSDLNDCQVSTLRRYVEALGGELAIVAVFGDKRISLVGATAPPEDAAQPANAGDGSPSVGPPLRSGPRSGARS
ncbi:MAG: XRE family transcriptional regulator [Polyangiaceae bacterium]|nr:XRE family transcriptional regulator [Polyangiaceae bacterium]